MPPNQPNNEGGGQTPPDAQKLYDSVNLLRDAVEVMAKGMGEVISLTRDVVSGMEDARKTFESFGSSTDKMKDGFKKVVNEVDNLRTMFSSLSKAIKGMHLDTKTYKEAASEFKSIKEACQEILNTNKGNKAQVRALLSTIRACDDAYKKLNENHKNGNQQLKSNATMLKNMKKTMGDITAKMVEFGTATNNIKLGKIHSSFLRINELLGRSGGRLEQAKRKFNEAQELRAIRNEAKDKRSDAWREKVKLAKGVLTSDAAFLMLNKELGGRNYRDKKGNLDFSKIRKNRKLSGYLNSNGEIDLNKLRGAQPELHDQLLGKMVEPLLEGGKKNWLDRRLAHRLVRTGTYESGGGLLEHGEGAVGRGVVEGALGGAQDLGIGAITKLAGYGGVAVAMLDMAKSVLDKVAKQNQETEKNLGKGGIFTTGVGGAESLANVRNNLRAFGLNGFNITTERMMAVAQTMQEGGIGLAELARPQKGLFGSPRAGTVGQIGDIVFKQAREVGLSDVEGTKQVIKLLQNYKLTLNGTQEFFRTIGKDIHAAGISTTKYLELIDEVTGQFNSMSKSIGTVTSLLRVLGATGTSTYEQLKEDVGALTEDKSSLEQRTALFQLNPETQNIFKKTQMEAATNAQNTLASGINTAITSLHMDKNKVWEGLNPASAKDVETAYTRFKMMIPANADANSLTQLLEGYQRQFQAARTNALVAQKGNPLQTAAIMDITGKTPEGNMTTNFNRLNTILGQQGTKFGEAISNPTGALARNPVLMEKLSEAFNGDTSKIINLLDLASNAIETEVKGMHTGSISPAFGGNAKAEEDFYAKVLKKANIKFKNGHAKELVMGMDTKKLDEFISDLKKNSGADDVLELLADPNNAIAKALKLNNTEDKTEQDAVVKGISTATRTIGEFFDTLNNNIIGWLGKPLASLVEHFVKPSRVTGGAHDAQEKEIHGKDFQKTLDVANKLESAAEANGTTVTATTSDRDGNKRSLKELQATYKMLTAKVDNGDVTKSTHDQLQTVVEDIQNIVSSHEGHANHFSPPNQVHPAASDNASKVKQEDKNKPETSSKLPVQYLKTINVGTATVLNAVPKGNASDEITRHPVVVPPVNTPSSMSPNQNSAFPETGL